MYRVRYRGDRSSRTRGPLSGAGEATGDIGLNARILKQNWV